MRDEEGGEERAYAVCHPRAISSVQRDAEGKQGSDIGAEIHGLCKCCNTRLEGRPGDNKLGGTAELLGGLVRPTG